MESSEIGMLVNGNTFTRSGNANDDRNCASELNFKSQKSDNNKIETIFSNKRSASNATNRSTVLKPDVTANHNNAKGPFVYKREVQHKFQNSEDLRKVIGDLDLNDGRLRVEQLGLVDNYLSFESHRTIAEILEKVDRLSAIERLLLYLRLPTGKDLTDPLKLPLNPLGSRFEISQTVTWIRTHLKENQAVSLPKQEVYEEYKVYCNKNTMKPLSTADFGKVMKQVFPEVRPRRLGTRGNSRYCYAGLCKMAHLPVPQLPNLGDQSDIRSGDNNCKMKEVVCSWLGMVMGKRFDTFEEIGKHLISLDKSGKEPGLTVSLANSATMPQNLLKVKSTEPNIQSRKAQENDSKPKIQETICLSSVESTQFVGRCKRKGPNLIVRKRPSSSLLNGNLTDKKLKSSAHQSQSNESVCDINNRKRVKEDLLNNGNQRVCLSNDLIPDKSTKLMPLIPRVKRIIGSENILNKCSNESNDVKDKCKMNIAVVSENKLKEKLVFSPEELYNDKNLRTFQIGSKPPIPRLRKQCRNKTTAASLVVLPAVVSPSPSITRHYKPKQPSSIKLNNSTETSTDIKKYLIRKQGSLQEDKNDNQVSIGCLEKDALDDYLHSDGNSQEQEEELLKYFQPQSPDIQTPEETGIHSETLSHLRTLLQKNTKSCTEEKLKTADNLPSVSSTVVDDIGTNAGTSTLTDIEILQKNQRPNLVLPSLIIAGNNFSTRRRVSFENLPDSVPQSPNTRRQIFNFTPISPTKTKSVCGSPFVPPRDMQVPRFKLQPNLSHSFASQTNPLHWSPVISLQSTSSKTQKSVPCHDSVLKSSSPTANLHLRSVLNSDNEQETAQLQIVTSKSNNSAGVSSVERKIFLLPCSPVSVCESPVFNIKDNVQSSKPLECVTEEKNSNSLNQMPSLLQSILTYGKYKVKSETQKQEEINNSTKNIVSNFSASDPLSQEVSQFFPEGDIPVPIVQPQMANRSHSVPVVSSSALMSPLSTTQPFPMFYSTPNQFDSSVVPTPVPSEVSDFGSVINAESSPSNFLLMTDDNDVQNFQDYDVPNIAQNDLLIDSAMHRIFEMITDSSKAPTLGIGENEKCQQPSRSYPNTPVPYSTCFENNSRDPIVSAFAPKPPIPNQQGSRSYPTTPVFSSQLLNTTGSLLNSSSTARRNINLLLSDLSTSLGLLTKEEEEDLSLQLPGCEDTFNVLATVVNDEVGGNTDL